jgi:hypothetical protein
MYSTSFCGARYDHYKKIAPHTLIFYGISKISHVFFTDGLSRRQANMRIIDWDPYIFHMSSRLEVANVLMVLCFISMTYFSLLHWLVQWVSALVHVIVLVFTLSLSLSHRFIVLFIHSLPNGFNSDFLLISPQGHVLDSRHVPQIINIGL